MTGLMAVLDLPVAHWQALEFLFNRVPPLAYIWALTGSAGLRLQGVDFPVLPLQDELEAYQAMRQKEKVALIRQAIQRVVK